ncbi:sensor histidine kinase [Burkholderiaceae bacterium UC74_6]
MRFPQAHPNSLLATVARGQLAYPIGNLFWLVYVLAAAIWMPLSLELRIFTWASLVVFLPLYFAGWWGDAAKLPRYTLAIAVLGLASVPLNAVFSYVLYAAAFIPYCGTRRQSMGLMALLLIAFAALASTDPRFSPLVIGFGVLLSLVIGFFGWSARHGANRDAALRLSHEEVRRLAASAERERIGRDLHDTLGATLALIAIKSELAGRLMDRDAAAARAQVADIETVAREALVQVRAAVAGIRSAVLVAEAASARVLLESSGVAFGADLDSLHLRPEAESALALALREAATNVQRHARAQAVRVRLRAEDDHAVMTIQDDGSGAPVRRGHGLRGMEERLESVGGSVEIASVQKGAERGTRLTLRVPLADSMQDEVVAPDDAAQLMVRPA